MNGMYFTSGGEYIMVNDNHMVTDEPLDWRDLRGYDGMVCCYERDTYADYIMICKKHQMMFDLMHLCVEIEEAGFRLPHERDIEKITQENVNDDYEAFIIRVSR